MRAKIILIVGLETGFKLGTLRRNDVGRSVLVTGRELNREFLVALRTRALRRRMWFRVLDRVERGLVDLTIRWVDRVKSGRLAQVLVRILEKLVLAMESRMVRVLEKGRNRALRLSELAVAWGNELAYGWRDDLRFQRALGLGALCDGHCSF